MNFDFPEITIITGHYGCGKTNIAVNFAIELAGRGEKVTVVDLDIVNPYFRTADFKELFQKENISLVAPVYANSNLDIPAVDFDLSGIISESGYVIIDVGGDPEGAVALGMYGNILKNNKNAALYYVVNKYRYLTSTPEEAVELLKEIEYASGLKCAGVINNSNLGKLTDSKAVKDSMEYALTVAEAAGTRLLFTCGEEKNLAGVTPGFPVKIYVKPIWEI